jgi:hypothetical protein
MTIVNEDSRVVTNLETSLTDDARVIIYDHQMFIVQAPGWVSFKVINFLFQEAAQKFISHSMGLLSTATKADTALGTAGLY